MQAGERLVEAPANEVQESASGHEAYLRAVFKTTPDCVKVVAPDGIVRLINPAGLMLLEADADQDVVGRSIFEFIAPEHRAAYGQLHEHVCRGGKALLEFEYLGLRGTRRFVRTNATPLVNSDGTVCHLAVTHDITEHRRAEDALRESEARFRHTADSAPVLIWMSAPDTKRSWFNKRWLEFVGRAMEQEIGDGWAQNVHPEDLDRCVRTYLEAFEARRPFEMEYRLRRHDGEYRWLLDHGAPIFRPRGSFGGYVGTCVDLTDRKRAEQEREISLARAREARIDAETLDEINNLLAGELDLRRLLQRVTEAGTSLIGAQFGAFFVNDSRGGDKVALHSVAGATREEVARAGLTGPAFNRVFRVGEVVRCDDVRSVRDNPWYLTDNPAIGCFLAVPVVSRSQEVIGGLFFAHREPSVFVDRSERLAIGLAAQAAVAVDIARLYEARRVSESRFRTVCDALPAMVWAANPDGSLFYLNQRWTDFTGRSVEEGFGSGWVESLHPDDRPVVLESWRHSTATGDAYEGECRYLSGDGLYRWHYYRGVPLRSADGTLSAWYGTSVDIHDRKAAEEARRESDERLRTLADNMAQIAWMADASGAVFWFNRRWYEFTGTTFEQVQGWSWVGVHHPDHEDVRGRVKAHCRLGEPWEETISLRSREGTDRWFLIRAVPIRNADGRLARWFGTGTDITERRELEQELARSKVELERRVEERSRELAATYDRLRLTERMAMMGTLSAGLGHDLGNLLVPVRVRLDSLSSAQLSPQAREDVLAIRNAAEYLRRLAQGLRLLSLDPRKVHSELDSTDLTEWWSEAQGVLKSVLPRGVVLGSQIPARAYRVRMSKPALTQVVFNLVQNAGEALRERESGTVTVRVRRERREVLLSVSDDGPGMTREVRDRCMEPFFTTKVRGISTGLGLVLVHGLVRDAGGTVELQSGPEQGTTFTLRLPLADPPGQAPGVSPRFALVEVKDARLRSFVAGELRSLHFETVSAGETTRPSIVVVDDEARLEALRGNAAVVFLGDASRSNGNIRVLGRKPGVVAICQALREAARNAPRDEPLPREP
ncbi:two-component system, NarL family, sensor histidine kinase EvgS [Phycisphaerales bacterium]|nr:two-component system, NarL family, sensor histidine kinase EvgS [Phycisphaerales bacterium]